MPADCQSSIRLLNAVALELALESKGSLRLNLSLDKVNTAAYVFRLYINLDLIKVRRQTSAWRFSRLGKEASVCTI